MIGLKLGTGNGASWWPPGASFAADFVGRRYMRLGAPIAETSALSFARASSKLAPDRDGRIRQFAPNVPAFLSDGLLLEAASTNLNPRLAHSNSATWSTVSSSVTPEPGIFLDLFDDAGRVASSGNDSGRRETGVVDFVAGTTYAITFWYAAGTSGRVFLSARASSSFAGLRGPVGAPASAPGSLGTLTPSDVAVYANGVYRVKATFVPALTSPGRLGIGPDSATAGDDVLALACQMETGLYHSSPIVTTGNTASSASDAMSLIIPVGPANISVTYLSGSTLNIATEAGGSVPLPATGALVSRAHATPI